MATDTAGIDTSHSTRFTVALCHELSLTVYVDKAGYGSKGIILNRPSRAFATGGKIDTYDSVFVL